MECSACGDRADDNGCTNDHCVMCPRHSRYVLPAPVDRTAEMRAARRRVRQGRVAAGLPAEAHIVSVPLPAVDRTKHQTTRRTSAEAFHRIKAEGLLSAKRLEVYEALYAHGPMTSAETFAVMMRGKRPEEVVLMPLTQTRARFTELRDLGCAYEVGEVECSITKSKSILWDVTEGLPGPATNIGKYAAALARNDRIKQLETTVAELRARIEALERAR